MDNQLLNNFVHEITQLTDETVNQRILSSFDIRRLLRFLSKVVLILEQSFQEVLMVMIEFKYLSKNDLRTNKFTHLSIELDQLNARSRYRDAEEICSRLHHLTTYYVSDIVSVTRELPNFPEWQSILNDLDEHEGFVIGLVNRSIRDLQYLIQTKDIQKISKAASVGVEEIRGSLSQLHFLNSQILGLSGKVGLLELTEQQNDNKQINLDLFLGDTYNVNGQVGSIGPNSVSHNNNFTQIHNNPFNNIDLDELSQELKKLRLEMKKKSKTIENDIAVSEIARAEQAAKKKETSKVIDFLKKSGEWALDIAKEIGVKVALEAIKQALNT